MTSSPSPSSSSSSSDDSDLGLSSRSSESSLPSSFSLFYGEASSSSSTFALIYSISISSFVILDLFIRCWSRTSIRSTSLSSAPSFELVLEALMIGMFSGLSSLSQVSSGAHLSVWSASLYFIRFRLLLSELCLPYLF